MTILPYELREAEPKRLGLIALQSDETIEDEFRRLTPEWVSLMTVRAPSSAEASRDGLAAVGARLPDAMALLPSGRVFDAVGFGCAAASAEIGVGPLGDALRRGGVARSAADPVSAFGAACAVLGVRRVGVLSPYGGGVLDRLLAAISALGVTPAVAASFDEAHAAKIARIEQTSIMEAARAIAFGVEFDALFLCCANMPSLEAIEPLEDALGVPVLSSNLVLAWRMLGLAGARMREDAPGRLFETTLR